ncbi:MAG: sterol desaturase family protein [Hyphomicrobiaceae bacterium]
MQTFAGIPEPALRFGSFLGIFAVMALLEFAIPRRRLLVARLRRWTTNLSIVAISIATVRVIGWIAQPLVAVGAAAVAEANGIGLLHLVAWPNVVEVIIALVVLDFAIWLQHVLSHRIPLLWRLHQMHHADTDIDVSTALRFHPIEIALSTLYKVVWVLLLGPSAVAVVLFEVILNGCAMFNHANVALPAWLDRIARQLIVTPDMHRIHHSVLPREHHTNFGFNLSIWDRLIGTYTEQPADGHVAMRIGLAEHPAADATRLGWCLALPFRSKPARRDGAPGSGP